MFVYVFGYNPIYVFKTYAVSLFALRDNISLEVSSWYVSVMELIPLVLTPLLGWWLTNRERIVLMTNVALYLMVIGYTLSLVHTLISVIVLGISLSLISASIWPYFSLTVKRKQQELAYGIVSSVSSLANVAMYPLAGYIVENDNGLLGIVILSVGLSISSVSIALLMWLKGK
jgi:predicted MFS family arabinose efflux permease